MNNYSNRVVNKSIPKSLCTNKTHKVPQLNDSKPIYLLFKVIESYVDFEYRRK